MHWVAAFKCLNLNQSHYPSWRDLIVLIRVIALHWLEGIQIF